MFLRNAFTDKSYLKTKAFGRQVKREKRQKLAQYVRAITSLN